MSVKFEGYERRIAQIEKALKEYGLESLEAARDLCLSKGVNVEEIVRGVQPIAFENAVWAYTLGAAIALKKNSKILYVKPVTTEMIRRKSKNEVHAEEYHRLRVCNCVPQVHSQNLVARMGC